MGVSMRIIDEKGRLFGKINVIDFLVILFLFLLTPIFYFGYILFKPSPPPPAKEDKQLEVTIPLDVYATFKNLSPEVAELIAAGDTELDGDGNVIGEILKVHKVEPNFITIRLSDNEVITKEDNKRKQVTLKIRLMGRLEGDVVFYKTDRVRIGSDITFKSTKYEINAMVIPYPSEGEMIVTSKFNPLPLSLAVILKDLSPEVANLISAGDSEVDNNGDTVVRLLRIGPVEPYTYKIDLGGGNYITKIDPQKKQIQAEVEIMGVVYGSTFYFREKRIALDSEIEFNTNRYKIKGLIVREPTPVKISTKVPFSLVVILKDLSPEVANLISAGDSEVDNNGDTVVRLLRIGPVEPYTYKIDLGGGNYITKIDPQKKQIQAEVEIMGVVYGSTFYFREKRIALDSEIEFNTNRYKIKGLIVREPTPVKKIEKKWLWLKARFYSLIPELVDIIKEGDEERDASEDIIARVDSIISIEPSKILFHGVQRAVESISLAITLANDPIDKDVTLLLRASCVKSNKNLIFKDSIVKVQKDISFETNKYDIVGKIIEIKEIDNYNNGIF